MALLESVQVKVVVIINVFQLLQYLLLLVM